MGQLEGQRRVGARRVVDDDVVHADLRHFGHRERTIHRVTHDPLGPIGTQQDRLTVHQTHDPLGSLRPLVVVEGPVVEDRAVLVDLHERCAAVVRCSGEGLVQPLAVGVQGSCHEGATCPQGHRQRVERVVHRSHR